MALCLALSSARPAPASRLFTTSRLAGVAAHPLCVTPTRAPLRPSFPHFLRRKMSTAAGQPGGDTPAFETIPVQEAAARLADGTPILDVRTADEFAGGHPPGAVNADVQSPGFLAAAQAAFPDKDAPLLVSCLRGGRSAAAAAQLAADSYTNVINVAGGWSAWAEAGLPVEK